MFSKFIVSLSMLGLAGAPNTSAPFDPVQGFSSKSLKFNDRVKKEVDWNKQLPCGANRATVTVRFNKIYPSEIGPYLPVAKVWLHSGDIGDSEQWAAAVLRAPTDPWKLNGQAWLEKLTGSKSEGTGYGLADLNRPIKLEFAWTAEGVVRVNFGGEFVKQTTLDKPIDGIGVSGSFVKFELMNLKVGRAGAPDPACDQSGIEIPQIRIPHPAHLLNSVPYLRSGLIEKSSQP